MAEKKNPKTTGSTGEAMLVRFLVVFASVAALVCFILGGIAFFSGRQETADQAPTATIRGTLQSSSPTNTPASGTVEPSNEPEQTAEPAQQTTEPTEAPTQAPAQTQAPEATQPAQSGGGTISNGDGTYTHDFSGGRVLATTESNNDGDPVYHIKDCQAAKKIPPENELWYNSENDAKAAERRLCRYCD